MQKKYHLLLFFTQGVSLKSWKDNGSLDREIALYQKYLQLGWKVNIVTYGDKQDLLLAKQLNGINILCNRWMLPNLIYEKYLHLIFAEFFARADVYKIHQIQGSDIALRASTYWGKPLVARCGFLQTLTGQERIRVGRLSEAEFKSISELEEKIFSQARKIIVTANNMKAYIQREYSVPGEKIHVIPNFVQPELFIPSGALPNPDRIIFVGRLSPEKNLMNLIQACQGLDVELIFIGNGPLERELRQSASTLNVPVNFLGALPNKEIPGYLNSSTIFILVSFFEGHPKALIEAMSCGLPVIGSNVPGIQEIIQHRVNGFLCGTDVQSIRAAIQTVLADMGLREMMGHNARRCALENYVLENVFEKELQVLNSAIEEDLQSHGNEIKHLCVKSWFSGLIGMAIGWFYWPWVSLRSFIARLLHVPGID